MAEVFQGEDSYPRRLRAITDGFAHTSADRALLASLPRLSRLVVVSMRRVLRRFLVRGAFFSCIQLLEATLLAYFHFFFIPPSTVGILAILSVLHTSALAVALSFRDVHARTRERIGGQRFPSHLLADHLVWLLITVFAFVALALGVLCVFGTDVHLSSPPIYRAMLMGWICSLPFEAGILLGLYSAGLRLVIISGNALTIMMGLEALCSCVAIAYNLPTLYLLSRMVLLLAAFRTLFPASQRGRPSAQALRESRGDVGAALTSFAVGGIGPAMIELSGKVAYLPFVYLDPAVSLTLVITQRLLHFASATTLRLGQMFQRSFARIVAFGERSLRREAFYRVAILLFVGASFTFMLVPLVFGRYFSVVLSSPYNDPIELTVMALFLFLFTLLLRAGVIGVTNMIDGVANRSGVPVHISAWIGAGALGLALGVSSFVRRSGSTFDSSNALMALLIGESLLLLMVLIGLREFVSRWETPVWTRRGVLGFLSQCPLHAVTLVTVDSEARDLVEGVVPPANHAYCRLQGNQFLVSHELSQLLAEERFLPFVEQQRIEFAPTRTLYNRGLSASPNLQIVAAFIAETRALLDKESTVTAIQYTAVPDLKIVSIPLLIDVDDVDRREDMMDYLDFVLDRGSLLAGRPSHRALGGICHLNWKVKPRYLLVFGPRARLYYSEIAYAVAHYNFFQAGLEEEPWPSVASEQFPAYRPRTISGRL